MHYFQISLSIVFLVAFLISLMYQVSLSIKVSTSHLNVREAMKKIFVVSFLTWMSMFALILVWKDEITWTFEKGVLAAVLFFFIAIVLAGVSALGLWRWKR